MSETNSQNTILKSNSIYIPNLNGVRFIAAFMVFIHHVEYTKFELNKPNIWTKGGLGFIGDLGVTLFFTLSGFLITYLLLIEKEKSINIKAFYIRRILRIWPLYYLIIILALFILPNIEFFNLPGTESIIDNFFAKTTCYLFILPNIVFSFYPRIPYSVQTWSIGVEEQFYLIWPFIIKYSKNIILTLGIIYIFFLVLNEFAIYYKLLFEKNGLINKSGLLEKIGHFVIHFKIGCMAAGGLASALYFYFRTFISRFINIKVQIITFIIIIFICFFVNDYFRNHEVLSIFFSLLILNFSFGKRVIINLEFQPLKYLGKISYGFYMYQFIAITIALKTNIFFDELNLLWVNIYYYFVSFILTLVFSVLSFELFEKKFILLKERFQIVKSLN